MSNLLNDEQMEQLGAMLETDAANPAPAEEAPEMEEAANSDPVAVDNETMAGMSEGNGEAEDSQALPDPNASTEAGNGNPQAHAEAGYQLPEGVGSVEELIERYGQMEQEARTRSEDMQALREMTGQLAAIAEALGYGQDIQSIDLNVDEKLKESDPEAYARGQIKAEVASQLKPMLEAQQKNLRGRMIDQAWKQFAQEHGDVEDLMEDIRKVIGESPELSDSEDGLSVAYTMARAGRYRPEKEMMEDDGFIARAAEHPKIRDKVIEKYLNEVARGGKDAPASVGGGGMATPAAKKKPMSMEEAKKGFLKMLGV